MGAKSSLVGLCPEPHLNPPWASVHQVVTRCVREAALGRLPEDHQLPRYLPGPAAPAPPPAPAARRGQRGPREVGSLGWGAWREGCRCPPSRQQPRGPSWALSYVHVACSCDPAGGHSSDSVIQMEKQASRPQAPAPRVPGQGHPEERRCQGRAGEHEAGVTGDLLMSRASGFRTWSTHPHPPAFPPTGLGAGGRTGSRVQSLSLGTRGGAWAALSGLCPVPRLAPLYLLLQPMAGCARVLQCAEAVPTLLQAFFSAVTQVSPAQAQASLARRIRQRPLQPHPGPVPLTRPCVPSWMEPRAAAGVCERDRVCLSLSISVR